MAGQAGSAWLRISIPLITAGSGKHSSMSTWPSTPPGGGGNDTVFLAGLADKVLALDIQLEAVRKTQKKTAGFSNVTVIQADHAELRAG